MFDRHWSAEQLERALMQRYGALLGRGGGASRSGRAGSLFDLGDSNASQEAEGLTGVLEHLTGLLENQALFRAEIDSLRNEIGQLKRERLEQEALYTSRIKGLQDELNTIRLQRAELVEQFLSSLHTTQETTSTPSEQFLHLPLVIRSGQNEYLGVAGRKRHFNLKEFIRIIRRNATGQKTVNTSWRREASHWILTIITRNITTSRQHEHVIEVMQTITPNRNKVVQLVNLAIDNTPVPEPFLLVLFKKFKDGFGD